MAANIEWVTGVIRAGRSFSEHGDAYEFSCTVNRRGNQAELIGGNGTVTPKIWRDVKAALAAQGITHAHWDRMNNAPRSVLASDQGALSIRPEAGNVEATDPDAYRNRLRAGSDRTEPGLHRAGKMMKRWRHLVAVGTASLLLGVGSLSVPAKPAPLETDAQNPSAGKLPDDMVVDAAEYPWSAVGRLNTGGRGYCTGVLVDEYHVLTDAHCLFYRTEGRWWQPGELHFVAGYQRDTNVTHSKVASYELAPGYRAHGGVSLAAIINNWALVKLRKPLGRQAGWLGLKNLDRKLVRRLQNGQGALLQAGYRRNAQHAITVGFDCTPDGFFSAESRIGNRCQLKPGRADLPFLIYMDGKFNVVANRVLTSIARHKPRKGSLANPSFRAKMSRGDSQAPKAGAASPVPTTTISTLLVSLGYAGTENPDQTSEEAIRSFESLKGLPMTGKASVPLLGEIIETSN